MNKDELLRKTLEDLGRYYPTGLYEFLFKHKYDLYERLQEVECQIDQAYLTGTVDDLKLALREYWNLHRIAIKEFNNTTALNIDIEEIRKEISENRIYA
jgi:hypothetical protein